jgi:hypothetical protein
MKNRQRKRDEMLTVMLSVVVTEEEGKDGWRTYCPRMKA